MVKLKASLRKFYVVNRYGIYVSEMTTVNVPLVVIIIQSLPHS